MISTLILWAVQGLFLKLAVGFAGGVPERDNSFGTAFLTAALLSVVQSVFGWIGIGILGLLWPIAWLFVVKSVYDIGWGRAVLVWLILVAISIVVGVALGVAGLFTFGLASLVL